MKVDIRKVPNVCKYCRKLMKQPDYPKTLELYRDEMLCLTVDVEGAAKLKLDENTLRYSKFDEERETKARLRLEQWKTGCVSLAGAI